MPNSKPVAHIELPSSLLTDPTKEPLRVVLKPYKGIREFPSELSGGTQGTMVFVELNKCFKRAGFVAEGLLGNIIWGFEQCGYANQHVASGLAELRIKKFIEYSGPDGGVLSEIGFDPKKPIWIRYTPKFLRSLAGGKISQILDPRGEPVQ